jgi:hypothetical protein
MATSPDEEPGGFLSRWSRRKVQVRQGVPPVGPEPEGVPPPPVVTAAAVAPAPPAAAIEMPLAPPASPPPTLDDVAALGRDSDYTRFVAPGVDAGVKNAALKKLFTDPHFNIMDGLDTYIDDYGKPDPLPEGMLRQMAQSQFLGLFDHEKPPPETAAELAADATPVLAAAPTDPPLDTEPDEDADLRLQPHDAAGPPGPGAGPEPDAGRPR